MRTSDMSLDRARLQMQIECTPNRENIISSCRARARRRERCAFFQYAEEPAPGSLLSLVPSGSTVHNTCHDAHRLRPESRLQVCRTDREERYDFTQGIVSPSPSRNKHINAHTRPLCPATNDVTSSGGGEQARSRREAACPHRHVLTPNLPNLRHQQKQQNADRGVPLVRGLIQVSGTGHARPVASLRTNVYASVRCAGKGIL